MTEGYELGAGTPQVLVVGAGPVGLTVAHELARRGVRVRLVDAADGPTPTSRAVATHARTLEIYDQMGVADAMTERGRRMQAFSMHRNGSQLVRLGAEYRATPTRFPFTLLLEQATTEEVLREAVADLGTDVEWGTRLDSLRQDGDVVEAVLRRKDGPAESVSTPWVVGCDGGHSTVRRLLKLPLIGDSTETWLIADAEVDMEAPQDSIHWIHVDGGTVMAVPFATPGKWRLLDTTVQSDSGRPDQVARRFSRKLTKGLGTRAQVRIPSWVSVFTIQQRMIQKMRVGRCFVAGDAAHVHSPASGQGLNTGIQEAFNLAWKLAMVIHGHAQYALLDSYSAERVPIGRDLLETTRKATRLVALKSALAAAAMPVVFAVVRRVPALRRRIEGKVIGRMSALRICYPDSPLTLPVTRQARRVAGPTPGERVTGFTAEGATDDPGWTAFVQELRDPRWTLLAFPDASGTATEPATSWLREAAERYGSWLSVRIVSRHVQPEAALPDPYAALTDRLGIREHVPVHPEAPSKTQTVPPGTQADGPLPDLYGTLADRLGIRKQGWLLIRPDAYLAARGDRLAADELSGALAALPIATSGPLPLRDAT
ncbi:FAD-dependent oxidoreductase (plasmid) [Streptomyces sp. NBC_00390]|uniref:FAD-dependent oxidoreductase n=1 Tax=Streptomyces sp. NBC_00390 TaxID=2975736 RepID=UPI002E22F2ED